MGSLYKEGTLGSILLNCGIITEGDIERALEEQKKSGLRLGEVLVGLGVVMQEDIDWALSHQLDIPYVRIRKDTVDPAAVKLIPASIARGRKLFPLIRVGGELRVAMADPLDKEAVALVERASGCKVSVSMGLLREILEAQAAFYGPSGGVPASGSAPAFMRGDVIETLDLEAVEILDLEALDDGPDMALEGAPRGASEPRIDALFRMLKEQGASDLHLSSGQPPIFRLHGEMQRQNMKTLAHDELKGVIWEILDDEQRAEFEEKKDIDFAYEIEGLARFRGNVFMQHRGIAAVFRIIPAKVLSADELKLPEGVRRMTRFKKGLVLVTGPTGSGKSTTLAAMIDLINSTRREHILTLEDPLEFIHENKMSLMNQRQVGEHTLSFSAALRAALREDPDIIMVGEMRDLETISLAMSAAETGHLVFGTLHTNTAAKTVDRIIDAFPKDAQEQVRTMLSESLKGVVCQQLLKKADGKGRVAALEIMLGTPALGNLIREGKTFQIPSIIQTAKRDGMQLLDQHLLDLLKTRQITPDEAYRCATDKRQFEGFLQARSATEPAGVKR